MVIVILIMFGVTVWAGVDAAFQPQRAWQAAGIDKGTTTAILVFSCVSGLGVLLPLRAATAAARPTALTVFAPPGG